MNSQEQELYLLNLNWEKHTFEYFWCREILHFGCDNRSEKFFKGK